jgi:peptidyl-tRNA hydrolase, PTH1 family
MHLKSIIGLGNPGPKFSGTRHNIGFKIIDQLANEKNANWDLKKNFEQTEININNQNLLLIKPITFMNNSGEVTPYLQKKGIKPEEILIIHDELEKPFGNISIKQGGSARGHNGLKSIIEKIGPNFWRLRFGIGRPEDREDVPNYVLNKFNPNEQDKLNKLINESVNLIIHPK